MIDLFGRTDPLGGLLGEPEDPRAAHMVGPRGSVRPPPGAEQMAGKVDTPRGPPGIIRPGAMPFMERLKAGLTDVVGGQFDPRFSHAENERLRKQQMIQSGLATLMGVGNGQGGLSGIAAGIMHGQQAGAGMREQSAGQNALAKVQQMLSDPALASKLTPQQLQMLQAMPPEQAMQLLTSQAFAPPGESKVVGEGATLVGPDGKPIFQNPGRPEKVDPWKGWPSEMRAAAMGLGIMDPSTLTPDQMPAIYAKAEDYRRSGGTNISLNNSSEVVSEKGITESMVGQYDALSQEAVASESRLNALGAMESLLDQGMKTGRTEDMTSYWRGIGAQFGLANPEQLGMQELFRGLGNKLALDMKEGMTGPMSDKDIEFLKQQVPALANTPQGNRLMIRMLRKVAQRNIELADLADGYYADRGTLLGWRRYRSQWLRNNPLDFSDLRRQAAGSFGDLVPNR